MKVKDVMSKKLSYATPDDSAMKVARLMKSQEIGAVPVVRDPDSMELLGIVTDRDLCNLIVAEDKAPGSTLVKEAMHAKPVTCRPEDSLEECEKLMSKHQIRRIPVVDDKKRCVGIVAQADMVRHSQPEEVHKTLLAISKPAHAAPAGRRAVA